MAVAHFRSAYEQRERNPFGGRLAKLKHVATGSRQRRSQVNVEPCYTLVDLRFPRFCKERFTTSRGYAHRRNPRYSRVGGKSPNERRSVESPAVPQLDVFPFPAP